jgi:transposase
MQSGIEPLRRFAKRLKPYVPGIVAHCRHRLHTSPLEGINNKIKVIKRMAYGFRDDAYFFLKISAAFPGIPRRTKNTRGPSRVRLQGAPAARAAGGMTMAGREKLPTYWNDTGES